MTATRCPWTLDIEVFGQVEELRCTKDAGHSETIWSRDRERFERVPSEHLFVITHAGDTP